MIDHGRRRFHLLIGGIAGTFCTVLFVLPLLMTVITSFRNSPGMGLIGDQLTFTNYTSQFRDGHLLGVLWTSVELGFVTSAISILLAYPVAYVIARSRSRFVSLLLALIVAPMFISSVVRAFGWMLVLGEFGPLNALLLAAHVISSPLRLTNNFTGVVIALVHWVLPFLVLVLVAAIHVVDPITEEAARDLGANRWQVFSRVTLPLTMPGVISAFLLALSGTVSGYTTVVLLGGGRIKIASMMVADYFLSILDYPAGSAVAIILLITTLVFAASGTILLSRSVAR